MKNFINKNVINEKCLFLLDSLVVRFLDYSFLSIFMHKQNQGCHQHFLCFTFEKWACLFMSFLLTGLKVFTVFI